jgi:asparagine synthetase B (glutamine-hydrolysing)
MYYCYREIAKDYHKFVLSGLVADAYFCFARNTHIAQISGPKSDPKKFNDYRAAYWAEWFKTGKEGLSTTNNPSGMLQHELLADLYKLTTVNPFLDKRCYNYLMKFDWLTLNSPKQKMPMREAWAPEIELLGHRPHRGYQTEAKVPKYFEQLLEDNTINFANRSRIMDVASDWEKLRNRKPGLIV